MNVIIIDLKKTPKHSEEGYFHPYFMMAELRQKDLSTCPNWYSQSVMEPTALTLGHSYSRTNNWNSMLLHIIESDIW